MLDYRLVNALGYPVLFARASLKHPLPVRYLLGVCRYPVLFARASLKQHLPRRPATDGPALPRAFCAGLIEALESVRNLNNIAGVTPCFLRGPH